MGNIDRVLDRAERHVTPLLAAGERVELVAVATLQQPQIQQGAGAALREIGVAAAFGVVRLAPKQFVFLTDRHLLGVKQRAGGLTIKATGGIAWSVDRGDVRATSPVDAELGQRRFDLIAADDGTALVRLLFPRPVRQQCDAFSTALGSL